MEESVFGHAYPSKPLPPEIHPVESLESALLKEVLAVWRRLCATGELPQQPSAMLPHIKPHIKRLHLSEVIDGGADFRFKVVGEAVFPGLGEAMGGRLVSQHPDPGIALRFGRLLAATREAAAPIRGVSLRLTNNERHDYRIESLWLPFGEGGRVTQILGLSAFMPLN
jgi:hypothetical protein